MPHITPTDYLPRYRNPTRRYDPGIIGCDGHDAERLGWLPTKLNEIIQGQQSITEDTALALARVLPYPADFWLNLEKNYRLVLAQREEATGRSRPDYKYARRYKTTDD